MNSKFIDIHSHILPLVDDGSSSFDESVMMLKAMITDSITDVILTPHYQSPATKSTLEEKAVTFNKLKQIVLEQNLNIKLHYGHEVRYQSHLKPDYKNLTLANSNYILLEFSYDNDPDIFEVLYNLKTLDLIVVLAHVERYVYLDYSTIVEAKEAGALIQVNAKSIYKPNNKRIKKLVNKLLKNKVIDFIASDAHNTTTRPNDLKKAYDFLANKYDQEYLSDIFYNNAKIIIDN